MTINYYYQYKNTGDDILPIDAMVSSKDIPVSETQIVVNNALEAGIKKFKPATRHIIFFNTLWDEEDKIIGEEEDLTKEHITIPIDQILKI